VRAAEEKRREGKSVGVRQPHNGETLLNIANYEKPNPARWFHRVLFPECGYIFVGGDEVFKVTLCHPVNQKDLRETRALFKR